MESHLAAEIAAANRIPFVACRVVLDPAHRTLPPAALIPLTHDGKPNIPAILRSVVGDPGQLPALLRLCRETWLAGLALRRGRHLLGPHFGCPYIDPTQHETQSELVPDAEVVHLS
jgi:hypothetical protein